MEEVVSERPIALAHVSSNILHDDIRYCTYHSHHSIWLTEDDAKRWEVEYLKEKHEELVLELARISSPHYLYIKNIFTPNYFRDDEWGEPSKDFWDSQRLGRGGDEWWKPHMRVKNVSLNTLRFVE